MTLHRNRKEHTKRFYIQLSLFIIEHERENVKWDVKENNEYVCGVKRYDPKRGTRTLKSGKEAGAQVFLRPLDCHRAHDQLSVKDTEGAAEGRLSLTDS